MPDPILPDLPQRIADEIRAAMPELASCDPHAGRFDLKELLAIGAKAPAVRVAILGLGPFEEKGGPAWEPAIRLAAYVVTADQPNLTRAVSALAIVERVCELVLAAPWAAPDMGASESVSAENLYGAGARQRGAALWAVAWRQPVQLGPRPASGGTLPAEWYATGLGADPAQVWDGGAA